MGNSTYKVIIITSNVVVLIVQFSLLFIGIISPHLIGPINLLMVPLSVIYINFYLVNVVMAYKEKKYPPWFPFRVYSTPADASLAFGIILMIILIPYWICTGIYDMLNMIFLTGCLATISASFIGGIIAKRLE